MKHALAIALILFMAGAGGFAGARISSDDDRLHGTSGSIVEGYFHDAKYEVSAGKVEDYHYDHLVHGQFVGEFLIVSDPSDPSFRDVIPVSRVYWIRFLPNRTP